MEKKCFKEGDLIVVSGETLRKSSPVENHYALVRVVAVGKYDIFAETTENRSVVFRVSRARCMPIPQTASSLEATVDPKLGDLVMSIVDRFGKVEKRVGVIMEITNLPSKHPTAMILDGDKQHSVPYDSLITLGEN